MVKVKMFLSTSRRFRGVVVIPFHSFSTSVLCGDRACSNAVNPIQKHMSVILQGKDGQLQTSREPQNSLCTHLPAAFVHTHIEGKGD
jgi:hypothetical protein